MLIKDPYLGSQQRNRSYTTVQPKNVSDFNEKQGKNEPYASQPFKRPEDKNARIAIQSYERQMRSLSDAYRNQEDAFRKMASLQYVNKEYHEAMKQRNFELNTKLNGLAYEKSLLAQRHEEQMMRNTYDKDIILRKYEEQNQQIIRLKRSNADLLEQKARLQSQIDHLMFLMEKDNQQGSLEIKEQLIRMENMERTLRGIIDTKDQEITQLRHRLKSYEDQNRRLNDLNKTLTITIQQKIDNLSRIQHLDSIAKFNKQTFASHMKSNNKQNIDANIRGGNKQNFDNNLRADLVISQLNEQKEMNKKLMQDVADLKKVLFEKPQKRHHKHSDGSQQDIDQKGKYKQASNQNVTKRASRLDQIRRNISSKVYDIYCKSIKQGERQMKNSLLIFIQKFKKSDVKQQSSQINEYMSLREELKSIHKTTKNSQIKTKIQHQVPMKIASRKHDQQNQWVLSTMQLTKNQRNQPEANLDKGLLTIEYRTKHPLQGKQINLSTDVQNQLLHSIVKATQGLINL